MSTSIVCASTAFDEYLIRIARESAVDAILVYLYRAGGQQPVLRSTAEQALEKVQAALNPAAQP